MFRIFCLLLILTLPLSAFARCEGTDLINAMPEDERAALTARASATVYPQGLLWRATKDDTVITLFGTYHFEHEKTTDHLEAVRPLIEAADIVYLEVSTEDQQTLQRAMAEDPSIMFITEGDTLPDLLGEEDWQRLSREMQARNIPGFMAARFKPFWAAMMLGIGPCEARNGLDEANGIDAQIGLYADEIGNPSRSLEDFRTLLTLFDGFTQEEQLDMIRLFFTWPGDPDDLAYTLRKYYLAEDIALIWEFSRHISLAFGGDEAAGDFAVFEQQLLINRNEGWIEVLMLETSGQHAFLAAGAAHLPGKHGLLNLLQAQGFSIQRLPFSP